MSAPSSSPSSCFIDSNIWLYAFVTGAEASKTIVANQLIQAAPGIIVSTQVINEVSVNLLKKTALVEDDLAKVIASFYYQYRVVEFSSTILLQASMLRGQYRFSFWDSLIVASALEAEGNVLYSEDMQHSLVVNNRLAIINPFTTAP